jgi:hypothetical protein
MTQMLLLKEQNIIEHHPSDITFLPDVNNLDSGYLFVTDEYDWKRLSIYHWEPSTKLSLLGSIPVAFAGKGPNFVFVDRVGDTYYLGLANSNWGFGILFSAHSSALFPTCEKGGMDTAAFKEVTPGQAFLFAANGGPSQVKLVRDFQDNWFLLAYRSVPSDSPNGKDYVDVYQVQFVPNFSISPNSIMSVHITFKPGSTGFASTGTHYVEKSGRLLISSSYRWSNNEGPGSSAYVSRVDEIPSA